MAYCKNCGQFISDNDKVCSNCGVSVQPTQSSSNKQQTNQYQQQNYQQYQQPNQYQQQYNSSQNDILNKVLNTKDCTNEFDQNDINENWVFAIFSYIGLLFLIPLLARGNSKFCKFHINQGVTLFIAELAITVVLTILNLIIRLIFGHGFLVVIEVILLIVVDLVGGVIALATLILAVMGIINVVKHQAKELPLISKFKILK